MVKKDVEKNVLYVSKGYDPQTAYRDVFGIQAFHFLTDLLDHTADLMTDNGVRTNALGLSASKDTLVSTAKRSGFHFQQDLLLTAGGFLNVHNLIIVGVVFGTVKNDCFHNFEVSFLFCSGCSESVLTLEKAYHG